MDCYMKDGYEFVGYARDNKVEMAVYSTGRSLNYHGLVEQIYSDKTRRWIQPFIKGVFNGLGVHFYYIDKEING